MTKPTLVTEYAAVCEGTQAAARSGRLVVDEKVDLGGGSNSAGLAEHVDLGGFTFVGVYVHRFEDVISATTARAGCGSALGFVFALPRVSAF